MRNNDTIDANSQNTYVRGSCTDSTWKSSYCPSFCEGNASGGEGMAKCSNVGTLDMYYCIDSSDGDVNCTAQQNVVVFPGKPGGKQKSV